METISTSTGAAVGATDTLLLYEAVADEDASAAGGGGGDGGGGGGGGGVLGACNHTPERISAGGFTRHHHNRMEFAALRPVSCCG